MQKTSGNVFSGYLVLISYLTNVNILSNLFIPISGLVELVDT